MSLPSLSYVLVSGLLVASPQVDQSVQRSLSGSNRGLRHCFALQDVEGGQATMRFRVGADRRPANVRAEDVRPDSPALRACLIRIVGATAFENAAINADVAYPISYEREAPDEALTAHPGSVRTPRRLILRQRIGRLIGDDWEVVDNRGNSISDLELSRLAGETALHEELSSRQRAYALYAAIDAAVAVVAFGAGGYGAYRYAADGDGGRAVDLGLMAGGGAVSMTAGALFVYHVIRAFDVSGGSPAWHHIERTQADQLVASANMPSK